MLGAYKTAERHYAGFDPSQTGYPAVHWVMMSAQGEGQYNSADDAYTGSFFYERGAYKSGSGQTERASGADGSGRPSDAVPQ